MKLGSTDISKIYLGSTEVDSAYLGSVQVHGGASPVLPYDAEVEYLQGDGTAYINTGWSGGSKTSTFSLTFKVLYKPSSQSPGTMLGNRVNTSSRYMWVVDLNSSNAIQVGYGSGYTNVSLSASVNDIINVSTEIVDNKIVYTCKNITTGVSTSKSYTLASFNTTSVYLFWCGQLTKTKNGIVSLQMRDNGILAVDYIAVRVGQTGYMYDRVSRQLCGNSNSSGAFILGNDKT